MGWRTCKRASYAPHCQPSRLSWTVRSLSAVCRCGLHLSALTKLCNADPLRVLRAVRFGARFDFKLDAQLEEAAASPQVSSSYERAQLAFRRV